MSSLTDKFISDRYGYLLHTNQSLLTAAFSDVYDGIGDKTSLSIGTQGNGATITGRLTAGNVEFPSLPSLVKFYDIVWPVGSVYLSLTNISPATQFKGTSWTQISEGRFLAGVGTGVDSQNTQKTILSGADLTQGTYNYTLKLGDIPEHYHYVAAPIQSKKLAGQFSFTSNLGPNNHVSYVRESSPAITTFDYALAGVATPPTVGRTSTFGSASGSQISISPPAFGVYIWKRIS